MDRPQPDYLQMSETDLLIPYWLLLPKLFCHQFLSSSSLMRKSVLPSKSWLSITDCRICNVQPLCKCCLLVWALPARIKKLEKRKIAQKTGVWNLPDKVFLQSKALKFFSSINFFIRLFVRRCEEKNLIFLISSCRDISLDCHHLKTKCSSKANYVLWGRLNWLNQGVSGV